jgi:putative ABC transport system permease protein
MAARPVRPPRVARFLVGAVVRDPIREYLLGDLEEQFARTAARAPRAAWRDYWRQALRVLVHARALRRPSSRPVAAASRSRSEGMRNLWRDFRLGLRTALRSPGYSAITALTLALAIGANTLLFSIANPLIVRGLPLEDPDGLGWIYNTNPEREITRGLSSLPDYLEWRAGMKSFTDLAAYELASGTLTGHGDAKRLTIARTSANLPKVWGLRPAEGRLFQPGEDTPGREAVGILSHRYLQEQFGGNAAVIGQTYLLDGASITIVGVMPKAIEIGNLALVDIWTPLPLDPSAARDRRALRVVGRLAPGSTITSADAELQPILDAQRRDHPVVTAGWQSHVATTTTALAASDTWIILALLGVVVVFVLLIACANLANLVLARLIARRQESAVRLALGASRWQLVRPLLSESLVLSLAGGLIGLGLATAGLRLITSTAYEPYMRALEIDRNVLVFNLLLSLATPLLFTLWPAITTGRSLTADILHGSRTSGGRVASRRRNVLVAGQVALALSLLVVSALVVQSMIHLRQIDLGMDVKPLLTYRFDLPKTRYADAAAQARFVQTLEQELVAIPGANGAAIATHMPVFEAEFVQRMSGTLHDGQKEDARPWASCFAITPGFFQASGIRLLKGRTFEAADRAGAAGVAVVGRLTAERYFDSVDNALGRTVTVHDVTRGDRQVAIVGVVTDTRDSQVTRTSPQLYVPFDQWPSASVRVFVRSNDPVARARDVQAVMRRSDPDIAISELKSVTTMINEELASSRIINGLFVGFAVLALALAAAGLLGVISYSVGQRRREIGIRLALGAGPATVGRMIVTDGLKVVGWGIAIGLLLAILLARASRSLLIGITPGDPLTFGAVVLVILVVAVVATLSPATRAMRVDPARTLRAE